MEVGDQVPGFVLPANGGATVRLDSLLGKPFVLYFYPKADTPGCTKEACGFQETLPDLAAAGVAVIGVSRDPVRALDAFAKKYALGFPLVSDAQGTLSDAFGTWVEKSMYGKTYLGMERATFLIDAAGRIARVWRKVKVPGHVAEVAAAAASLGG